MADEVKTPETEVLTPAPEIKEPVVTDEVQIDRTELERLRASDARIEQLNQNIGEFDSIEDYRDALEDATTKSTSETDKPNPPPTTPSETVKTPPPQQSMDSINHQMAQNTLLVHWIQFDREQEKLPEDQRSKNSQETLTKLLYTKGALIREAASQGTGNLFDAANDVLNLNTTKVADKATKAGAAVEIAKANAAASATIPTGGEASLSKTETPEELASQTQKADLDRMLPDDPKQVFE